MSIKARVDQAVYEFGLASKAELEAMVSETRSIVSEVVLKYVPAESRETARQEIADRFRSMASKHTGVQK